VSHRTPEDARLALERAGTRPTDQRLAPGKPELLQQGQHNYLLNGDRTGKVISNKDMQSGASSSGSGINVNVNITNTNGSYIDQQVTSDGAGGVTVDVFIADMDNGGPMSQSIMRNTSATRRANA